MRNKITITQDNNVREYPSLLVTEISEKYMVKFKKIDEF